MASKKTPRKTPAARKVATAVREYKGKAEAGKAKAGIAYNPAEALPRDAAAAPELREPRPATTSRYPISEQEFEALRAAAAKAKLPAVSAVRSKDFSKRGAAPPPAMEAMAPGLEPSAAPLSGSANRWRLAYLPASLDNVSPRQRHNPRLCLC